MKLATLSSHDRNGQLIVVSKDNKQAVSAASIAPSVVKALENWGTAKPKLEKLSQELNAGKASGAFALDVAKCLAPIPNAPGFYDGSAFLSHVYRARKARGDELPPSAKVTPLMYQGVSDNLLAWNAPISIMDPTYGGDFEGEFAVVTTDVPRGTKAESLPNHVALLTFFNDITYREVLKTEIETKFGFLQSKPNSSFAPFLVTPEEVGKAWHNGRLELDVEVKFNKEGFGNPNGREMHFSFYELVAHACRTRPLAAGSIVGSGTVSNEDKGQGYACLTEKRFVEVIDTGKPSTPWLKSGDHVWMNVAQDGVSVFGAIDEKVTL